MGRWCIALVLAPLWVPGAVALYSALVAFPSSEQRHWIFITTLVAAAFAYFGTLAIGVPAYLLIRRWNEKSLLAACALGFVIGALTWVVFALVFPLSLGTGFSGAATSVHRAITSDAWWLMPIGSLGATVGATIWIIVRPDRNRAPM